MMAPSGKCDFLESEHGQITIRRRHEQGRQEVGFLDTRFLGFPDNKEIRRWDVESPPGAVDCIETNPNKIELCGIGMSLSCSSTGHYRLHDFFERLLDAQDRVRYDIKRYLPPKALRTLVANYLDALELLAVYMTYSTTRTTQ